MESTPVTARIAPWILVALVLAWWIAVKTVYLFHAEYTSDLFTHYQLTTGWLEGRPLLYENCFGFHGRIHNYYLSPALGFFTVPLGVWGLVAVQGLTLAWATAAFLRRAANGHAPDRAWPLFGFVLVVWLGPVSFYVFDDPYYGWHPEVLFLPLALLHGLALRAGRWPAVLATAALIALTKEDGAVLGCCVGLAYLALESADPGSGRRRLLRRAAATLSAWGAVFVAGQIWLQIQSDGNSPLGAALGNVLRAEPRESLRYLAGAAGWPVLLGISAAPLLLALVSWRMTATLFLLSLPLVVTSVVSGLWYYPDLSYGPAWSPRVGTLWAYGSCCAALAVLSWRGEARRSPLAPLALSLVLQLVALRAAPEPYRFFERLLFRPVALLSGALHDPRLDFLNALGERLPADYPVAPPSDYFGAFRRQQIFWWDHPQDLGQPELYVCDGACDVRFPGFDWSDKSRFRLGDFEFIARADIEHMIREQFARSALASGDRHPRAR
jgi:hypothetical protein